MKALRFACGATLVAGILSSNAALADHGHGHWGMRFYFGMPYAYPYYPPHYYPPYPYYPPVVMVPQQAPVYVEQPPQATPQPTPQASGYWSHCEQPEGYYPYIKECPGGWQKVPASPPQP